MYAGLGMIALQKTKIIGALEKNMLSISWDYCLANKQNKSGKYAAKLSIQKKHWYLWKELISSEIGLIFLQTSCKRYIYRSETRYQT